MINQNFSAPNNVWNPIFLRLNKNGELVLSRYLSGNNHDHTSGLRYIEKTNEIVVVGVTESKSFPTTDDAYQRFSANVPGDFYYAYDLYLSILSLDGELKYSTYIGGSYFDTAYSFDVDANLNVYIVGRTTSNDLPFTNQIRSKSDQQDPDAYLLKFNRRKGEP